MSGKKEVRTNAMRILDSLNVEYSTVSYEYDEEHLDAVHAASSAGIPSERVFKTIVMISSDKRIFVFVTPAGCEISLKKARALTGAKSIELLKLDLLLKTTGYIRGGCSPIGMIHTYPTFVEESALLYDRIFVSAGLRGLQLELSPDNLVKTCNATVAEFV